VSGRPSPAEASAAALEASFQLFLTVLVDAAGASEEIAHLCYRQSVSPALVDASNPPAPDPARRLVLVAVSIDAPKGEARDRIHANAEAGTIRKKHAENIERNAVHGSDAEDTARFELSFFFSGYELAK